MIRKKNNNPSKPHTPIVPSSVKGDGGGAPGPKYTIPSPPKNPPKK